MPDPDNRQNQPAFLEQFQDELIYILECLVQDYTGESKSEISRLIDHINATPTLDRGYSEALVSSLKKVLQELRQNNQSKSARNDLITLRRRLCNTRLELLGHKRKYNSAEPLTKEGVDI